MRQNQSFSAQGPAINEVIERVQQGKGCEFRFASDGTLMQGSRICVPDVDNLRNEIMLEAYYTPYCRKDFTVVGRFSPKWKK